MTDTPDHPDRGGKPPRRPRPSRAPEGREPRSSAPRAGGKPPFKPRGKPSFGERSFGDRAPGDSASGDRPFRKRADGDRPFKPRGEGSFGDRPKGDRPFKPRGERSFGDRPRGDNSRGDRPFKPRGERSFGDRPFRPRREDSPRRDIPRRDIPQDGKERIAKAMARAGVASRRDAEAMIEAGRVTLNGEVLTTPAVLVGPADVVMIDGTPIPPREKTRLWLYHKPAGLVTTTHDPEGRPTVFDHLPAGLPRVVSIGRLDINTEGLLLLTNDGGLAEVLAHPRTGWLRRYRVRAFGEVTPEQLDALADGVTIDEMHYGPIEARIDRAQGDNVWLTLGLREGKNREVKRVLEHLGLQVNRLIRLSFGPFQLGEMEEGTAEEVRTRVLKDQLGHDLAAEAGVQFDLPTREEGAREEPRGREAGRDRDRERGDRPGRDRDRGDRPYGDRGAPRGRDGDRNARPRFEPEPRETDPGDGSRLDHRPSRAKTGEPARAVWRDAETEAARPYSPHRPRRGKEAAVERMSQAERPRERAGRIADPKGRAVTVERILAKPEEGREPAPRQPRLRPTDRPDQSRAAPQRAPRERGERTGFDRGDRPAYRSRRDADGAEAPRRGPRDDSQPFVSRGYRPRTEDGGGERDRPAPRGDRPFRERSFSDRPFRERPFRERPSREDGDRPRAPREDRPFRERPAGERSAGGRGFSGGSGDRTFAKKSFGKKPFGSKPFGASGDGRPRGERPGGEGDFRKGREFRGGSRDTYSKGGTGKSGGSRSGAPYGKGPGGGRPGGGKPGGGRPGGKPGGKPGGAPRGRRDG